jgi:DNA repair protein SbcC/Rad50
MVPLTLSLTGFLSYRDLVEIDFTRFDLACISGHNGAGKSSLLDAITWVLFGQARKTGEALLNSASPAAEIVLTFQYEGNVYRVQRTLPRGKTTILEFHIQQSAQGSGTRDQAPSWKPLTERTLRDTQFRIEQTLRLDYDTFINASFFLQGKADQFTQQRPGDRKRILASILGLDAWDVYKQRAAERRKSVEGDIHAIDGRLTEITTELAEEDQRKAHLAALDSQLLAVEKSRKVQEKNLENIRKMAAALVEQRKLVEALARQVEASTRRLADLEVRMQARQSERQSFAEVIGRETLIQQAYQAWQQARLDLEKWEATAEQFREQEKRRQPFLDELNAARARLLQEQSSLLAQQAGISVQRSTISDLSAQVQDSDKQISALNAQLDERAAIEGQLDQARQRQSDARAENPRLKAEMDELKIRIDQLSVVAGAVCPLCGQPLDEADRQRHITELTARGKELGDRYRANQIYLREAEQQIAQYASQAAELSTAEKQRLDLAQVLAQLKARLDQTRQEVDAWDSAGAPRLAEVAGQLERDEFNLQTRLQLAAVDTELAALGYDAAAHDAARHYELEGRAAEAELRTLERAQAALEPLEREIADLELQRSGQQQELERQRVESETSTVGLSVAEEAVPDLDAAERELLNLQEQENRLRMEVGAARQKVLVLDDLKTRRKALEAQREEQARLVGQYRQLERAFGKDGVPALLIEQALPQIRDKANDILDRLSGGRMTVDFVTQREMKTREDLKETLEIQISDSAGTRDYEMFSGGEAFRVNFAIRLALSEVLAQRAGARLQTLVIDEGFGSQDTEGRQRLVEAINLVRPDFSKILVITHIDELKDAFPTRLEVEKTERGSMVQVI